MSWAPKGQCLEGCRRQRKSSHLWRERVNDLTCERLCKLEDEENSELAPRKRCLARLAGLGGQERGLLISHDESCSHGGRKMGVEGGRRRDFGRVYSNMGVKGKYK